MEGRARVVPATSREPEDVMGIKVFRRLRQQLSLLY
ncbi:hypothetical protein C7475_105375 [Chitinophaga sp. S165]|nr:hypothetical protein C7475_105375 [Chitinophaga sp. S165]